MLPCYQLLRSEEAPSSEQAEQFDFQFRQLSEQIQATMTAFRPGFFVRLFTGMGANYWTVLEQELQQQLSALSAMGIQGSMLQGNLLCYIYEYPTGEIATTSVRTGFAMTRPSIDSAVVICEFVGGCGHPPLRVLSKVQ